MIFVNLNSVNTTKYNHNDHATDIFYTSIGLFLAHSFIFLLRDIQLFTIGRIDVLLFTSFKVKSILALISFYFLRV